MKTILFTLITSVALVAGCASATNSPAVAHGCTLLKFPTEPSAVMVQQLAATQPGTTPQEVREWFAKGERGFVLASTHTNEIAAAVASGATATTIRH